MATKKTERKYQVLAGGGEIGTLYTIGGNWKQGLKEICITIFIAALLTICITIFIIHMEATKS